MYEPVAYNPDQPNAAFADGRTAQLPPEGTVRAKETFYFPYSKDDSGFVAAGRAFVKNPIARKEATLAEGKALYSTYCSHCNGDTGQGDGGVHVNGNYTASTPQDRTSGVEGESVAGRVCRGWGRIAKKKR